MTPWLSVENTLITDFRSGLERMFFQENAWVAHKCCTFTTCLLTSSALLGICWVMLVQKKKLLEHAVLIHGTGTVPAGRG